MRPSKLLFSILQDGEFGAMMIVNIANDGPVTLELDSRKFEYVPVSNNSSPKPAKAIKDANGGNTKQDVDKTKKGHNKERQDKKEKKRAEEPKGENTDKTIESTAAEGKDTNGKEDEAAEKI